MIFTQHPGRLNSELLAFYGDKGHTPSGYTREQVLGWPDRDWEIHHDFIQWIFPTDQASMYNSDAPVLDAATITRWRADHMLLDRLRQSFDRWLKFCGIVCTSEGLAFDRPNPDVWNRQNHNWLRITRVLRSLTLLGLTDEAQSFFALLTTVRTKIDRTTWSYWDGACQAVHPSVHA